MSIETGPEKRPKLRLYLTLTVLMAFWGYAFVAIKFLLKELKPLELTVLRFLVVLISICLFMIYEISRRRFPPRIHGSDALKLLLLGFTGVVCYHMALNFGEMHAPASVASIIVFTSPIFTAIFASFMLKERLDAKKMLGIAVAIIGSAVILLAQESNGANLNSRAILGSLIVFISPVSWAIYTIYGRKIGGSLKGINRLYFSLYTMLFGSLFLLLFFRASTVSALLGLSPFNLFNLFVLSVLSSFLGYIIWVQALEHLEATKLSAFLYLIPVYTLVFSYLLLGERLTFVSFLGAAAIFFGVYLIEKS